jgi:hypothetical protein
MWFWGWHKKACFIYSWHLSAVNAMCCYWRKHKLGYCVVAGALALLLLVQTWRMFLLYKWFSRVTVLVIFLTSYELRRGPDQYLPSHSAPVLRYGSRPSSDFLAEILVWTLHCLFGIHSFILHVLPYSYLFHRTDCFIIYGSSLFSKHAYGMANHVRLQTTLLF